MQSIAIENYSELLAQKVHDSQEFFTGLDIPDPLVFDSDPAHFRMRAEFRLWHDQGRVFYAMFDPADKRTPIEVEQLPIASKAINALMPRLLDELNNSEELRHRVFLAEFLSGLSGEVLLTLAWHRKLDEKWERSARQLSDRLGIPIIGRAKKQKIVIGQDSICESLTADGRTLRYQQYEGGFTQPNAGVNQKMITWACEQARRCSGDLLELYCGNGNFTIALARYFDKVLATEIAKVSIKAATENMVLNDQHNIEFARLSAEEMSQAIKGVRPFRRLEHLELADYELKTLFVDPPRAGLDDFTCEFASAFEHILYISCNAETMARDLQRLAPSHTIEAFAFFDQFPYTHHMECGAYLVSKTLPN